MAAVNKVLHVPETHTIQRTEPVVVRNGTPSIEQMRKERILREQSERLRAQELLNPHPNNNESKRHEEDDRYYHSQFNPNLVRKPKRAEYSNTLNLKPWERK